MFFIPQAFDDPRFPLGVVRMDPQMDMGLHHHPYVELVLIRSGSGQHLAGDHALPLAGGQVFVIPPGLAHGYADCRELRLVNLCFDPQGLGLPEGPLGRMPGYQALFALEPHLRARHGFAGHLALEATMLQGLLDRADELARELRERKPAFELAASATLQHFLITISRHYQAQRGDDVASVLRFSEVLARIDRHLAEPISVERLARWGAVSTPTLQRWFRARFSCSASAYVTRLRLERARTLLLHGDLTIASISERVGIADHNYFARLFRRHHGAAPAAWRAAHRPVS